jgi:hypothetical protein
MELGRRGPLRVPPGANDRWPLLFVVAVYSHSTTRNSVEHDDEGEDDDEDKDDDENEHDSPQICSDTLPAAERYSLTPTIARNQ